MRPYILLAAAVPLVLARPHPVAIPAPAPVPIPKPQTGGEVTNPITSIVSGLAEGALDLQSLDTAIPAVLTDLADVLTASETVARIYLCFSYLSI